MCQTGHCVKFVTECPGVINIFLGTGTNVEGDGVDRDDGEDGDPVRGEPNGPEAYDGVAPGCTHAAPFKCFDFKCVESISACIKWKNQVINDITSVDEALTSNVCGVKETLCGDGSCSPNVPGYYPTRNCPIIPRCPHGKFRLPNGACGDTKGTPIACSTEEGMRCEDGGCRQTCLPFNGCPLTKPFHCNNRRCAADWTECNAAQIGVPGYEDGKVKTLTDTEHFSMQTRRLLYTTIISCETNCFSEISPIPITITIDTSSKHEFTLAVHPLFNTPIAWLVVPSGSIVGSSQPAVQIRPVPESIMRYAENSVHPSRWTDFGGSENFGFQETLLSPAFMCVVDNTTQQPFQINAVEYRADIDSTREPITGGARPDVCLARLTRFEDLDYARWECLQNPAQRTATGLAREDSATPYRLQEAIPDCGMVEAGEVMSNGAVYGYIHAPYPASEMVPASKTWVERNTLGILMISLTLVILIILVFYFAKRLHRYREKYQRERKVPFIIILLILKI
jgi:hypothetical protein